jgi:hypothetical protein
MNITEVNPKEIKVELTGSRKDFFFYNSNDIKAYIKVPDAVVGKNVVNISKTDFIIPKNLVLERIQPISINISLKKKEQLDQEGELKNGTK